MGYLTKEGIISALFGFIIWASYRAYKASKRADNATPLHISPKFWLSDRRNLYHLLASIPAIVFILWAGAEGIRFMIDFSGYNLEHDVLSYGEKVICFLIGAVGDVLLFKVMDKLSSIVDEK